MSRLFLQFQAPDPVVLGLNYHEQVQGMIYNQLDDHTMRNFLHDHGFYHEKRKFKLFTFSRIMGKCEFLKGKFIFEGSIGLYISSPWVEFLQVFARSIITQRNFCLGSNHLYLQEIDIEPTPDFKSETFYKIRMLAPVTIYSTLLTLNGSRKTYFYAPGEREFSTLIRSNLVKKASAFYGEDWSGLKFMIKPDIPMSNNQQKILKFKGFIIKGWLGDFVICGDWQMLKIAFEAGLGGKNSQGFGMFKTI